MQTIETRFHGPTNHRGSRIIARASDAPGSVTLDVDHLSSLEDNHVSAALQLAEKLDWRGRWFGGHTNRGMVWVMATDEDKFTI